ncbi:hypothetical protein [Streptomyces ureilyticus]|uniref:Lipoprotein n=1 Tax=Streptomyces ureilyticus TaxID=1775131 RepID=A0ABX0E7G3_9ACTN|nr:hypothetical protein [Streptomyces ureilyticus]NGO48679.1 hypothetical protein [Streptomyces ureilyticus]
MIRKRTGGRWLCAVLAASAALTTGCTESVDAAELPGVYCSSETGGEIELGSDGTFSATGISADDVSMSAGAGIVEFSGTWDFLCAKADCDFVYLTADDGDLGGESDVQLYTKGPGTVYLHPDPDGPVTLELDKGDTR